MNLQSAYTAVSLAAGALIVAGIGCNGIKYVPGPADDAESAAGSGPHIVFAELSHDFGKVTAGAVLEHTFAFSNRGREVLELSQPKGS